MAKKSKIPREIVLDIFKHFGMQEKATTKAFLNAAGLETSHMKDAVLDTLPLPNKWGKIKKSAEANGWKATENAR